ncbi:MAG: hypothetical protein ACR2QF_18010, partial [Geminicoccaceae bacterium]
MFSFDSNRRQLVADGLLFLTLIQLVMPRTARAADVCTAASNTISTVQLAADRCDLGAGEIVDITATGSIPYTGTGDAMPVNGAVGSINISGNLSGASDDGISVRAGATVPSDITISGTITASDDA